MIMMLTTQFWHHVMMDTEDELRAEVLDTTRTAEEHNALADALNERESAHAIADHLAQGSEHWSEVRSATTASNDTEDASAAMSLEEMLNA